MDGFGAGQLSVDFFADIGRERRDESCQTFQNLEGGVEHRFFVLCQLTAPETAAVAADIPVGQILIDKILDLADGLGQVVDFHFAANFLHQTVVLGQNPAVDFRALMIIHKEGSRVDAVGVGVQSEEVIGVLQCIKEFTLYFL